MLFADLQCCFTVKPEKNSLFTITAPITFYSASPNFNYLIIDHMNVSFVLLEAQYHSAVKLNALVVHIL